MDRSNATRDAIARKTFLDFGTERLVALCESVDAGNEFGALVLVFRHLVRSWGQRHVGERPRYRCNIADDEAPFGFSLALSNQGPEVQVYVEPQGELPSLRSNMAAGRSLLESLARDLDAPLDRLHQIEDLFFPAQPCAPFALWIGASWRAGSPIRLKVCLNPQVRGTPHAYGLVTHAMERLGFGHAWATVHRLLTSRDERDVPTILSLDLWDDEPARVKINLRHREATATEIEAVASITQDYQRGDVSRFYTALMQSQGPFLGRPAITELAFIDPRADRPASSTIGLPIRSYVADDQQAFECVGRCMAAFGVRHDAYANAIRAFATRPLDERAGIHAHVTLRRVAARPRVAVYLASEAYVRTAAEG